MNVQFIRDKDISVAYFSESKRFFRINEEGYNLIQAFANNMDKTSIQDQFKISVNDYNNYKSRLDEYCNPIPNNNNIFMGNRKLLGRLVIHLSNCCNLRCKYCYANGGTYHSDSAVISKKTIDDIFSTFYNHFDKIHGVQLFGGEPLMNMDMIEYICKTIRKRDVENDELTMIGLVTNGTLIDDKFIYLVKEYKINVTISYDGYPSINDMLRMDINGGGTSKKILDNANRLKAATGQPDTIEVTYTSYHKENDITIQKVMEHISQEIPDTFIHLVPAGGTDEYVLKDYSEFIDSIDDIFNNIENSHMNQTYSIAQRFITALVNKTSGNEFICDAGLGTLSVNVKGDIYPCFMFTDNEELLLGNIYDKDVFDADKFKNTTKNIYYFNKKEHNDECNNCTIKTLCNGCLGLHQLNTNELYKVDKKSCDMFRSMAEKIILKLAKLNN